MEPSSSPDQVGLDLADCRHWLLAAHRRREPGSAQAFVGEYDLVAYRAAWRVLRVREDAEEVAQDTLFGLLTAAAAGTIRPRVDARAAEANYVRRAAVNRALNRFERLAGQPPTVPAPHLAGLPDPRSATTQDDARTARLWACLGKLEEIFFEIIERRFLSGLSVKATGDMLGIPPGTVKSRTATAIQRLAECCRPPEEHTS